MEFKKKKGFVVDKEKEKVKKEKPIPDVDIKQALAFRQ